MLRSIDFIDGRGDIIGPQLFDGSQETSGAFFTNLVSVDLKDAYVFPLSLSCVSMFASMFALN
jgi:hypothetical protein